MGVREDGFERGEAHEFGLIQAIIVDGIDLNNSLDDDDRSRGFGREGGPLGPEHDRLRDDDSTRRAVGDEGL
jgi:hypothetical protein